MIVETVACVDDGVESVTAAVFVLFTAPMLQGEGMDLLMLDMCDGAFLLASGATVLVSGKVSAIPDTKILCGGHFCVSLDTHFEPNLARFQQVGNMLSTYPAKGSISLL